MQPHGKTVGLMFTKLSSFNAVCHYYWLPLARNIQEVWLNVADKHDFQLPCLNKNQERKTVFESANLAGPLSSLEGMSSVLTKGLTANQHAQK